MDRLREKTSLKAYIFILGYILLTVFLLLYVTLKPTNENYVYAVFKKDISFAEVTHLLHQHDIQLIETGAIDNGYMLYMPNINTQKALKKHTSFLLNPIFAQGCTTSKNYI